MGNQKLKWTAAEEIALTAGVAKHGAGRWKNILKDSKFARKLANRTNVDLKDKWRNIVANHEQISGPNATTSAGAVPPKTQKSSSAKHNVNNKPPQSPQDVKDGPKCNEMILEALSSIKDHSGANFAAIIGFIERKYAVPQSFRRLLSSRLRKLVLRGKLEKVQKRYKLKRDSLSTKTEVDAAKTAAHNISEAENRSFWAAKAVKESERVSQRVEDADAVLMHLKGILQQLDNKRDDKNPKSSRVAVVMMV